MVYLSEGCGKMEGIISINTNPFLNEFCNKMSQKEDTICNKCYSRAMLKGFFRHLQGRFSENTKELSTRVLKKEEMPEINEMYVRINSHGELVNKTHLMNIINIATNNDKTQFALWTKRAEMVRKELDLMPSNITLIYSTREINSIEPVIPHGFDKVFSTYTNEFVAKNEIEINCHGKCMQCKNCYKNPKFEFGKGPEFINEIIKKDQRILKGESREALIKRLFDFAQGKEVTLEEFYKAFPQEEQYVIRARLNEAVKKTVSTEDFRYRFERTRKSTYKSGGE